MFLVQSPTSNTIVLQSISFHFSSLPVLVLHLYPQLSSVRLPQWSAFPLFSPAERRHLHWMVGHSSARQARTQRASVCHLSCGFLSQRYLSSTPPNVNTTSKYHAATQSGLPQGGLRLMQASGWIAELHGCRIKALTSDVIVQFDDNQRENTSYFKISYDKSFLLPVFLLLHSKRMLKEG